MENYPQYPNHPPMNMPVAPQVTSKKPFITGSVGFHLAFWGSLCMLILVVITLITSTINPILAVLMVFVIMGLALIWAPLLLAALVVSIIEIVKKKYLYGAIVGTVLSVGGLLIILSSFISLQHAG
jgi:hypothetical protein